MAKPVIKKTTAPVVPTKATRSRETVLIKVTAAKLKELIGNDTPIGVSRKELKALIVKSTAAGALADAGL